MCHFYIISTVYMKRRFWGMQYSSYMYEVCIPLDFNNDPVVSVVNIVYTFVLTNTTCTVLKLGAYSQRSRHHCYLAWTMLTRFLLPSMKPGHHFRGQKTSSTKWHSQILHVDVHYKSVSDQRQTPLVDWTEGQLHNQMSKWKATDHPSSEVVSLLEPGQVVNHLQIWVYRQ